MSSTWNHKITRDEFFRCRIYIYIYIYIYNSGFFVWTDKNNETEKVTSGNRN